MSTINNNYRVVKRGHDLSKFQAILRQKCQQQMRERRNQLFNKGRASILPAEDVQEALTEIVRREFKKLAANDNSELPCAITIINGPLSQDEALKEEHEIIAEQEQWLMQEYERLMRCEERMFDALEDEAICPMCQKSFLEEIPDFIVCHMCGLKIRTEISLTKFKCDLEMYVNVHSRNCTQVPDFSLIFDKDDTALSLSCSTCLCKFLIKTVESQ
ncbi:RPA-interacting protein A-like [Copidosoma floridanum]|uniref:RPA-interacting protein A-like n=1 Tax=Copidosoma floridanum TaxID=29053 RepID=UPI0006C94626|nr:RPA-interacting protein A-like [Copidosoma floridanum]